MSVNAVMAQTFLPGVSRNEIEVFDPQAWNLADVHFSKLWNVAFAF